MKKRTAALFIACFLITLLLSQYSSAGDSSIPKLNSIVEYKGDWLEIGRQQAYYFPEQTIQVAALIQLVLGVSSSDLLQYYEDIKDIIPESVEQQMQGIAEGLTEYWYIAPDRAWNIVLALELGGDAYYRKQEDASPGCTAFAFHSDNGTFLAHNSDQPPTPLSLWAVARYVPDTGDNAFISFGVPAGAVSVGMVINDKGLGITFNVGRPNKNSTFGVPLMHMTREVIAACGTLNQAVTSFTDLLERGETFSYMAGNILIVDFREGSMARLQVCSKDIKVTYGQELKPGVTYLACTNHFDDDFSPLSEEDKKSAAAASSLERYKRLMEIIPQFELYDLETCWSLLTDQGGGAPTNNTISRKSDSAMTVYSNVFTADTTYYTIGVPTEYLALYKKPQEINNQQVAVPSIIGTVLAGGQPLAKALVSLEGLTVKGIHLKTRTAADGTFIFNNLESGTYSVRVKAFYHLPRKLTIEYTEGQPRTVNVNLL
jgi:predicted choloylglycine hydrolase